LRPTQWYLRQLSWSLPCRWNFGLHVLICCSRDVIISYLFFKQFESVWDIEFSPWHYHGEDAFFWASLVAARSWSWRLCTLRRIFSWVERSFGFRFPNFLICSTLSWTASRMSRQLEAQFVSHASIIPKIWSVITLRWIFPVITRNISSFSSKIWFWGLKMNFEMGIFANILDVDRFCAPRKEHSRFLHNAFDTASNSG